MKERIYRAGVIPFFIHDDGKIEMHFMIPSDSTYSGSSPQFCKGKVESHETHQDTAIRESSEELGLRESNVKWFSYLGQYLGYTHIYICEVEDKDAFDVPHHETEYTKWLTLEEFEKEGRALHRPVIREAHNEFKEIKREEEDGIYDGEDSEYEYHII